MQYIETANDTDGATLPLEDAEIIFTPLRDRLIRTISGGWDDYWDPAVLPDHTRAILNPTTRSNFVYDFMCSRARQEFTEVSDVEVLDPDWRSAYLLIGGRAVVRFKRMRVHPKTGELVTCNVESRRQMKWAQQAIIREFPSYATLVNAGYVLNAAQTDIELIALNCRVWSVQAWRLDLFMTPAIADGLIQYSAEPSTLRPIVAAKPKVALARSGGVA